MINLVHQQGLDTNLPYPSPSQDQPGPTKDDFDKNNYKTSERLRANVRVKRASWPTTFEDNFGEEGSSQIVFSMPMPSSS